MNDEELLRYAFVLLATWGAVSLAAGILWALWKLFCLFLGEDE